MGCFEQVYSAEHLRRNPRQSVRRLTIEIEKSRYGYPQIEFGVKVWLSGGRQIWRAGGQCEAIGRAWHCKPDTDGAPQVIFRAAGKGLRATNPQNLQIFDDETGSDLNTRGLRPPGDATFVLQRVPASVCRTEK